MKTYLSLSETNQFAFTCPVFNVDTKMAVCMKLREIVWKGEQTEKRRGCQAAMKCGQCPAAALVSLYSFNSNFDNDHHGSPEPKKGRLMAQVLDKVANVLPQEKVIAHMNVPPAERELLLTANQRVVDQLKTAPGESSRRASDYEAPKRTRSKPAARPAADPNINQAARTGDMAAALNAA